MAGSPGLSLPDRKSQVAFGYVSRTRLQVKQIVTSEATSTHSLFTFGLSTPYFPAYGQARDFQTTNSSFCPLHQSEKNKTDRYHSHLPVTNTEVTWESQCEKHSIKGHHCQTDQQSKACRSLWRRESTLRACRPSRAFTPSLMSLPQAGFHMSSLAFPQCLSGSLLPV